MRVVQGTLFVVTALLTGANGENQIGQDNSKAAATQTPPDMSTFVDPNSEKYDKLKQIESAAHQLQRTPYTRQNLRQRVETLEQAETTLEQVRAELPSIELNLEGAEFEAFDKARDEGAKLIDAGIEEVTKVVQLMRKAEMNSEDIQEMIAESKRKRRDSSRRRLASDYGAYEEATMKGGQQSFQQPGGKSPGVHARFSNFFEGDTVASNMHSKFSKMHDAIMNNDHNHMHRLLKQQHKKANHFQKSRRLQEQKILKDPLEREKGRQCQILVECAKGMSFYDTFIFFYSDDIDIKAGTIDKDILHFDDDDLPKKYSSINKKAKDLYKRYELWAADDGTLPDLGNDQECDNLLRLFHRNIEFGDVPHWEGATVSQVCLAEGSAEFIGLGEVARSAGGNIATMIAEEQMNCAWDLFNSKNRTDDPRYEREVFAFADEKQHKKTERLSIQDLLIPVGVNLDIRDKHGKILSEDKRSSEKRFYTFEAFHSPDLRGLPPKERRDAVKDAWDVVQDGFDLAFGEKQSVGFICGIKEGVHNRDQPIPGHCCLDAPFENTGDAWGRKFDCSMECKHPGPFLSGLSEESCSAHGGTWCQSPPNCQRLQSCIDDEIVNAEESGLMAYAVYLKGGIILNPHDAHDCGRSTEYFGFDETYNNYEDVCRNIIQLQNTKNFEDLENFFNQGSKGSDADEPEAIPEAEIEIKEFYEELEEPTRDRSGTEPVTMGDAWSATNFALEQVLGGAERVHSAFNDVLCPDDGWGITWTICATFKNILAFVFNIVLGVLEIAVAISEFTRGELCDPSSADHLETLENTDAIFDNMKVTFNFIDHVYKGIAKNQEELAEAQSDMGEILQDQLIAITETLAYVVEKIDKIPTPEATHRPTPEPTRRPTPAPTLEPGHTHPPTSAPSAAPSVEAFCEEVVRVQNLVDSDWYFKGWCTDNHPCVASVDPKDGTFWLGEASYAGNGPDGLYGKGKVFHTASKSDTRAFMCGLPFEAVWNTDDRERLHFKGGVIEQADDKFEFSRCKPKYSLEDISSSEWIQDEWGCSENQPCVQAKLDEEGRLWMGNPNGHSGYGPNLMFGQVGWLHTTSEAETHKLMCGDRATAMVSSPGKTSEPVEDVIRMPDGDTVTYNDGESMVERACTPIYTLGDVVDSEWYFGPFGCGADGACTAQTDKGGILRIGWKNGNNFDKNKHYKTESAAETRKLLCGQRANFFKSNGDAKPISLKFDGDHITEMKSGGKTGFRIERMCSPIYSVEDITKYEWSYPHWKNGRGLTSRLDGNGKLWVGLPGTGYGPDNFYGRMDAWNTASSRETRRLLCGLPAQVAWDNGNRSFRLTMVNGNKITFKADGSPRTISRTAKEAEIPALKMYTYNEGTKNVKSWTQAVGFCKSKGAVLASHSDYCTAGGMPFGGIRSGDQWSPFSDYKNGWVQVGDIGRKDRRYNKHEPCVKHDEKGNNGGHGVKPNWGDDSRDKRSYEGNFILCKKTPLKMFGPADGTKRITNWEDAKLFCEEHDMVLASKSDYCAAGKAYNGVRGHDEWAPFGDYPNAWIHIGTRWGECEVHGGAADGHPAWGVDNKKQAWEANYVLCGEDQSDDPYTPPEDTKN